MNAKMPRARSTDRRFYGVAIGVVAEPTSSTPDARIPLRLPWYDRNMVTDPCRVAQLYAGNGYGAFWQPEVGDEVVVAFIHGDMRDPVVIGGLYNGVDRPPTNRTEDRDEKLLVTKGGHRIVFDDKAQTVTVATKSGTSVTLDGDNNTVTISADAKIVLKAKDIELIADGGDVTVRGKTIRLN